MLSYIYIFVIFSFYLISFPISVFGEGNNPAEAVSYLDSVAAHEFDLNSAINLTIELDVQGFLYESGIDDLKAFLNIASGNSDILVEWKKATLRISIKGEISNVRWRPKHTSFIYPLFDIGSGGDFGTTSFHYVSLRYLSGKIDMKDIEISSHQLSTDLGWSSDGKYYAYSEAASLRIKNFETGKVWATKLIIVDTKAGKVRIPEGTPKQLSGFIWLERDRKLLIIWKNHPFDDAPVGAAVVNIDQFKLD